MNHADKRNRKRNSEEKLQAFYGPVKFHFYWMAYSNFMWLERF